jgi:hypothetical protein
VNLDKSWFWSWKIKIVQVGFNITMDDSGTFSGWIQPDHSENEKTGTEIVFI